MRKTIILLLSILSLSLASEYSINLDAKSIVDRDGHIVISHGVSALTNFSHSFPSPITSTQTLLSVTSTSKIYANRVSTAFASSFLGKQRTSLKIQWIQHTLKKFEKSFAKPPNTTSSSPRRSRGHRRKEILWWRFPWLGGFWRESFIPWPSDCGRRTRIQWNRISHMGVLSSQKILRLQ